MFGVRRCIKLTIPFVFSIKNIIRFDSNKDYEFNKSIFGLIKIDEKIDKIEHNKYDILFTEKYRNYIRQLNNNDFLAIYNNYLIFLPDIVFNKIVKEVFTKNQKEIIKFISEK